MGIISIEKADRLYWLGRYSERVYGILRLYAKSYDELIDGFGDSYIDFCNSIDIPNVYSNKEDFEYNYAFNTDNPDSIFSNLYRAYDNAIELRDEIGSEALSYIQLCIYEMKKARISTAPLIEMQNVIDYLLSFWGLADDFIPSEQARNILKAGKRIERIDLWARLGKPASELTREANRLAPRVERCGLEYNKENLVLLKELVNAPEIDYYKVVQTVESII